MKTFKSPQTSSEYKVFFELENVTVCYRILGSEKYRVRIQGEEEILNAAKEKMICGHLWGKIKDKDHLSIVVPKKSLIDALCSATRGIALSLKVE